MKSLVGLFIIIFCTSLFSQENDNNKLFSNFKLGLLSGVNVTKYAGGSVQIEGKTDLTTHFNMKAIIGYSKILKKEGYNVKTYGFNDQRKSQQYVTSSYNIDRIDYDVFQMAVGLEYSFVKDRFSPYIISEAGYNYYSFHIQKSNIYTYGTYYDTYDQIPADYRNKPPRISDEASYLFGLGIGTTYRLGSAISLDIRYLYQYNKNIVNTNQILIGINF